MPRNPPDNEVSRPIGRRIRQRRILLGMSQDKLGVQSAVSFQQVQKYEMGRDSPRPGRLDRLARAFAVPGAYFFDELISEPASAAPPDLTVHGLRLLRRLQQLPPAVRFAIEGLVSRVVGELEDEMP